MAQINVATNPARITAADTDDNELVFSGGININAHKGEPITAGIVIVSGTFTFNVGGSAALSTATFTAGDKLFLSFTGGASKNIHFKAAGVGNSFDIYI